MGTHIMIRMLMLTSVIHAHEIMTRRDLQTAVKNFSITIKEYHNSIETNSAKGYYRYLELSTRDQSVFYVGAMNNLFVLGTSDLRLRNSLTKIPDKQTQWRCPFQGKSISPDCQNHIRLVLEYDNELQICSTGAYAPTLFKANIPQDNSQNMPAYDESSGINMCPFDPLDNYTAILVRHGNPGNAAVPYIGTYSDFLKEYPVIYRPPFKDNKNKTYTEKHTDKEEASFLKSPQFVGSFDVGDAVYMFFRETAIEYPLSKNKIYSRVGKVCKKDLGGGSMDITRKKWLSFQKARLVCSLPGVSPYEFDDIYDVYRQGDRFYALFIKLGARLNGSAICVYNIAAIEKTFGGDFKYRNPAGTWETLPSNLQPNTRLDNCKAYDTNQDQFNDVVSKYQLMDDGIIPIHGSPIYYKHGVQLMRLVINDANNTENITANIYAASSDGEIYSIFYKAFPNERLAWQCELNAIYLPMGEHKNPENAVWNMKLINNTLLMGTDVSITSLNINCSLIKKMTHCIGTIGCEWNGIICLPLNYSSQATGKLDHRNVTSKGIRESVSGESVSDSLSATCSCPVRDPATSVNAINNHSVKLKIRNRCLSTVGIQWDPPQCTDTTRYSYTGTGDLVIQCVSEQDKGVYIAKNEYGETLANITLTVNDPAEDELEVWRRKFACWSEQFNKMISSLQQEPQQGFCSGNKCGEN